MLPSGHRNNSQVPRVVADVAVVVVVSSPHQSPKCGVWRVEKVLAADSVGR